MYSNFPKGELKAVFGIEGLSNGMWWEPALRSNVVKYVAPFSLEKNVLYFWHGPCELSGYLVKSSVIYH